MLRWTDKEKWILSALEDKNVSLGGEWSGRTQLSHFENDGARTNNLIEGYHRSLATTIGRTKPDLTTLTLFFKDTEVAECARLEAHIRGGGAMAIRNLHSVARDEVIRSATQQLRGHWIAGTITVQFVSDYPLLLSRHITSSAALWNIAFRALNLYVLSIIAQHNSTCMCYLHRWALFKKILTIVNLTR